MIYMPRELLSRQFLWCIGLQKAKESTTLFKVPLIWLAEFVGTVRLEVPREFVLDNMHV